MLSGCPCGVKNTLLLYVLWRKGDQNRHLDQSGASHSAFLGWAYGKGKAHFHNFLVKIKNRMEFLHVGRAHFIFCP